MVGFMSSKSSSCSSSFPFQSRIYKGRIDGHTYYTYYVNLIRACKKFLYQFVYIGKKFVFFKKNLCIYVINQ